MHVNLIFHYESILEQLKTVHPVFVCVLCECECVHVS